MLCIGYPGCASRLAAACWRPCGMTCQTTAAGATTRIVQAARLPRVPAVNFFEPPGWPEKSLSYMYRCTIVRLEPRNGLSGVVPATAAVRKKPRKYAPARACRSPFHGSHGRIRNGRPWRSACAGMLIVSIFDNLKFLQMSLVGPLNVDVGAQPIAARALTPQAGRAGRGSHDAALVALGEGLLTPPWFRPQVSDDARRPSVGDAAGSGDPRRAQSRLTVRGQRERQGSPCAPTRTLETMPPYWQNCGRKLDLNST